MGCIDGEDIGLNDAVFDGTIGTTCLVSRASTSRSFPPVWC
jgi:hypothetical protein